MAKKNDLISNLAWKFSERISAQIISTVVSIILARMLGPSQYGVIAIVMIFIALANVFVSDGFGSALIQKKDANELDFFSVLYFNIGFSCVLYLILFFTAPFISNFYGDGYEILTSVLRVLGLRIILTAINSVQQAYVSKKMMFKSFFIATLWGTIISAVVGIVMAYSGYGVWSLVAQYLVGSTVSTFTLMIILQKKPKLIFSLSSLKGLFPFGVRILSTGLLITGYQELRALIIGKIYSPADLAYYNRGRNFPNLIVTNINSSIGAVLFPKLSSEQDDKEKIKSITRNSIRFSAYIMCPMMLGLATVATPFIRLLLTEKWMPCVPLLQMFCIIYLFQPIHTANMQAIKAMGKSDIYLRLEIVKKVFELVVLLVVMWISVNAIVVGMAICTTIFTFVNAYPNIKLLNYGIKEQMNDILPSIGLSLVMVVCVYSMQIIPMNDVLTLIVQGVVGAIVYIALSIATKNKEFSYIKNLFDDKIKSVLSK